MSALLDAQAGVEYEGEDKPTATEDERLAIEVWNHLSNGQGGIDWAGLPFVVELLGISDVEALIHRLKVIKAHRPPEQD